MQEHLTEFHKAGIEIVALSYDSEQTLARFANDHRIRFPLLSDPDSEIIRAFGLLNEEADSERTRGIPHPGTVLLDSNGTIRAKLFHSGYRARHAASEIIEAAAGID